MEKVPQIVSERLRAASSAVGHPDPDVLTAFSECSLPKSERAAVVEHLARCGECREIVALALPATESAQQTARPTSDGWLTWPVLRWGFIAAGVAAIASFGVMRYQHRMAIEAYLKAPSEATTKEAKNLPPAPSAAPAENRDQALTPPSSKLTDRKDLSLPSAGFAASQEIPTPALGVPVQSKHVAVGGALPHGPRVQWQQNTNLQQQAAQVPGKQLGGLPLPSAPPSANHESAEVQSAETVLSANADSSAVPNQIDQQALQHGPSETKVERSKPPVATASQPMAAFPASNSPVKAQLIRQNPQAAAAVSTASVLWTISAAGKLQRSLDRGTTWQDIDVNSPFATAGASLDVMKDSSKAKEVAADILAKKDSSGPLVFRAIASNGLDVWAGASSGLLYHSTDAGSHWTRIIPSASGVSLTGDIVSLEFVDPQHGRVVTSTPEIWTTSDSGQSWQKQ